MAITNIALVLQEMTNQITNEFPTMKFVHDHDLSYESAIAKLRSKNEIQTDNLPAFPLFVFRRTVLRRHETNKRLANATVPALSDSVDIFKTVHGTFTVDFMLTSTDMNNIEDFEIRYMAEDGFSSIKELTVSVPGLGDFIYFAHWRELTDLQIINEGNTYASLTGSIDIMGWHFTASGNSPVIKTIELKIESFLNEVFVNKTITS